MSGLLGVNWPVLPRVVTPLTPKIGSSASHRSLNGRLPAVPPVCVGSDPPVTFRKVPPLTPGVLPAEDDERHVLLVVVPGARHLGHVDDDGVVDQHVAVDVRLVANSCSTVEVACE